MPSQIPFHFSRHNVTKIQAAEGVVFVRPIAYGENYLVSGTGQKQETASARDVYYVVRDMVNRLGGPVPYLPGPLPDRTEFMRPDPPLPPDQRPDKGKKSLSWPGGIPGMVENVDDPEAEHYIDAVAQQRDVVVYAAIYTDYEQHQLKFQCQDWFKQATDEELLVAGRKEWGRDYEFDDIGWFCMLNNPKLAEVFEYIQKNNSGFEVYINEAQAVQWIKLNRPYLLQPMGLEGWEPVPEAPGAASEWDQLAEALEVDDPDDMWDRMTSQTDLGEVYELLKKEGFQPDYPEAYTHYMVIKVTGHPNDVKSFLIKHNVYNAQCMWADSIRPGQHWDRVEIRWRRGHAFWNKQYRYSNGQGFTQRNETEEVDPEYYVAGLTAHPCSKCHAGLTQPNSVHDLHTRMIHENKC